MTNDRTSLIDEARAILQNYHGDRDADDIVLIDAVDVLATLAGLTYLVDDHGVVTLEATETPETSETDAAVEFLPGDDHEALPCLVVSGVQVYSYFDDTGLLRISVDTEGTDGVIPIEFAVNGVAVTSLPGALQPR